MLVLDQCSASWGGPDVFSGLSLRCAPGDIVAVLGPSGCGKSTLLKLCAGLLAPSAGSISLGAEPPGSHDTAIILQDYGLFPWYTVKQNIGLALRLQAGARAVSTTEARRRVDEAIGLLGLAGLEDRYPETMSGGQLQRVALARALVLRPALLLLDEPFNALDALTREQLQELFRSQLEQPEMISLLVTHSVEEAVYLGNRILYMVPSARLPGRLRYGEDAGGQSTLEEIEAFHGPRNENSRKDPAFFACCARLRQTLERRR